ncbi:MAG: M20/M25/M40 family metallo-hydrolase [Luteimonas sp.]
MRRVLLSVAMLAALAACARDDDAVAPVAPVAATPSSAVVVAKPAAAPSPWADNPGALRIQADVAYLADDRLQGREAGTAAFDVAAAYVATRFETIGLEPAGDDGGFFQTVPLLKATRQRDGAQLSVRRNGRRIDLRFAEHYLPAAGFDDGSSAIEAAAVFVGQAIHAPSLGHDDFKGVDLRKRIAVILGGAPATFDNDRRAFYASTREKLKAVAQRGAIGAVLVNTIDDEARAPWSRSADNWDRPSMRLRGADGDALDGHTGTLRQLRVVASVAASAAELVFADAPQTAAQLFAAAQAGTLKSFALPGSIALAARTRIEPAQSRNVVARLRGSDAARRRDNIVYSAHLDHIGVGKPVNGDRINNGALDNALGVAILLEAARTLAKAAPAPKRSLLFVATTAEEKGLLGAEWFARHPTVPATSLIANINLDMPVLMAPTTDVVPIGVEHSTLKATLDAAAQDIGVALSPDPFPEENVFVRSDQYAFIRAGIPAVYLLGGVVPADTKTIRDPKLALHYFLRNCYHRPCDDAAQPIQYGDAERLARLNARIGVLIGDAAARPAWNKGDFFGTQFAKPSR